METAFRKKKEPIQVGDVVIFNDNPSIKDKVLYFYDGKEKGRKRKERPVKMVCLEARGMVFLNNVRKVG